MTVDSFARGEARDKELRDLKMTESTDLHTHYAKHKEELRI